MSLIGALNAGKSALAVSQAAIQTTGNNIANVGNADYTRQNARITAGKDQQFRPGIFLGTGINLEGVQRSIDEALEGRLRGSISDNEAASTLEQWLGRVESVFNELTDQDLSTQLSTFFNSWSNLANKPQDVGLRQVVVQNGASLASWINDLRGQLGELKADVDNRMTALTANADQVAGKIAKLNSEIVLNEAGSGGEANGLRDQRDGLLKELSQLMDVQAKVQGNNGYSVYVGSEPLVINGDNRGVALRQDTNADGELASTVVFKANDGEIRVAGGQLGALDDARGKIDSFIDQLDALAGSLVFELNKLHSSGQGLEGLNNVTSTNVVDDATAALNDDKSGLDFKPANGSFVVHVKSKTSGLTTSTLVEVDLDGLNADDTTLNELTTALDDIADISATSAGGTLNIKTDSNDVEISFSQDSSGVLASLGIGTFFNGTDARTISLNQTLKESPRCSRSP
ncbi:MAG: flagellar hook-associated protein FlgK [Chthoniobacterales bacterium]|nr:flagellar hook-associated protein FlgK [Chthoniobacterales bacterium]